jgi:uncharacterized protein (UPF0261 family)
MKKKAAIAVVGTFDSKGEELLFLKKCIEERGLRTLTINVGTARPLSFEADIDLFPLVKKGTSAALDNRDMAIQAAQTAAQQVLRERYARGEILGAISAGGGTGTYLGTGIMRVLPLGVPKVMVSTVASRDMAKTVGTKDITMIHSVVDLLGLNSISRVILEGAAGAVCGMVARKVEPQHEKKRIALTFFGFVTRGAERVKESLEEFGYEVIPFHANGTGGMAMEELASEGYFSGILDFATHELADRLMGGYCGGIGPNRLEPPQGLLVPRLVVPGGMDCAVLEFTRETVPEKYKRRKLFFYDFRSAIRLSVKETVFLAAEMARKLNLDPLHVKVLVPLKGFSEADRIDGPLFDQPVNDRFINKLKQELNSNVELIESDLHINDSEFAEKAAQLMGQMIKAAHP